MTKITKIIKNPKEIRAIIRKLELKDIEEKFKSKNINELIDKLTKHKKFEIKELEEINLSCHPPYYQDYKEGYIEALRKCIDILKVYKTK